MDRPLGYGPGSLGSNPKGDVRELSLSIVLPYEQGYGAFEDVAKNLPPLSGYGDVDLRITTVSR